MLTKPSEIFRKPSVTHECTSSMNTVWSPMLWVNICLYIFFSTFISFQCTIHVLWIDLNKKTHYFNQLLITQRIINWTVTWSSKQWGTYQVCLQTCHLHPAMQPFSQTVDSHLHSIFLKIKVSIFTFNISVPLKQK